MTTTMNVPDVWKNRIVGYDIKPAAWFLANPDNWRIHPKPQQEGLAGTLDAVGWVQDVIVNIRTAEEWPAHQRNVQTLVDGHLRVTLALRRGDDTPVPMKYVDLTPTEEILILSTLDPIGAMAAADRAKLKQLQEALDRGNQSERIQKLLADIAEKEKLSKIDKPTGLPGRRQYAVDAIFTLDHWDSGYVGMAIDSGFKWGFQSSPRMLTVNPPWLCSFIDNDYFDYNHAVHLDCVKRYRPKYATVRDAMTPEQCAAAGIKYFPMEQILDWAEELLEHAGNVIVIPKYEEALETLPEKFMAGFSVPTSHGGTPVSPEKFRGRRVHLLGGSWKDQLAYMYVLGDDVVSFDNNYINYIADVGEIINPDGVRLGDLNGFGLGFLTNPRTVSLACCFGAIGAKLNELFVGTVEESKYEK